MAAKKTERKKTAKRTTHRIEPWAKSKIPPGTMTVTISLVHIERMAQAMVTSLRDPQKLEILKSMIDQILNDKMSQRRKGKTKKKSGAPLG